MRVVTAPESGAVSRFTGDECGRRPPRGEHEEAQELRKEHKLNGTSGQRAPRLGWWRREFVDLSCEPVHDERIEAEAVACAQEAIEETLHTGE